MTARNDRDGDDGTSDEGFTLPAVATGAVPSTLELTGGTVNGRYRLTGPASPWAVGRAHPAVDLLDHELVVLVYPDVPVGREMELYRRAAAEVERTRPMRGTSLVCMRECGALANGRPYFVMKRVQALSVQKYVGEHGPLPVLEALALIEHVVHVTARAHMFHIVLGDIRPANIFVIETRLGEGRVALEPIIVDTGYARGIFDGLIDLPEPPAAYRSPQRRASLPPAIADDIYALGALLSFLVTGRAPRVAHRDTPDGMAWGPSRMRPDLRLPSLLDRVVLRATSPEPDLRWRDLGTFLEALTALRQVLALPAAAKALLDDLMTGSGVAASARDRLDVADLSGLAREGGLRVSTDPATRELGAGEIGVRPTATVPFDPRDVASAVAPATTVPIAEQPPVEPTRPLTSEQLRKLLRVIDSPSPPPEAELTGAMPLDPPKFAESAPTPPIGAVPPAVGGTGSQARLTLGTGRMPLVQSVEPAPGTTGRTPTGQQPVIRPTGERALLPMVRTPSGPNPVFAPLTAPLPAAPGPTRSPTGPNPVVTGPNRSPTGSHAAVAAPVMSALTAQAPAPQASPGGALPSDLDATPPVGPSSLGLARRGLTQPDLPGQRPLALPPDVHTIPPAHRDEAHRRGSTSGRWVLGAAILVCLAGIGYELTRDPPPPAPPSTSARGLEFLPSASVEGLELPRSAAPVRLPTIEVDVAPSAAAAALTALPSAATRSTPAPAPTPAPTPAPAPASSNAPATVPPALNQNIVDLQVESVPSGLHVLRTRTLELLCAATPCELRFNRFKPGTRMAIRLVGPGFGPQDEVVPVDVDGKFKFTVRAGPGMGSQDSGDSPGAAPVRRLEPVPSPSVPPPPPSAAAPTQLPF